MMLAIPAGVAETPQDNPIFAVMFAFYIVVLLFWSVSM